MGFIQRWFFCSGSGALEALSVSYAIHLKDGGSFEENKMDKSIDSTNQVIIDSDDDPESMVSTFHRVQRLIPEGQELRTIGPEKPMKEAFVIMQRNHYSQLLVVIGDAVLGVFYYRSFSTKAVAL